ncbi:MAG: hypothetical protein WCR27_10510 [Eubacteriales bacterium]
MAENKTGSGAGIMLLMVLAFIIVVGVIIFQFKFVLAPQEKMTDTLQKIEEINTLENQKWDDFMAACKTNEDEKIIEAAADGVDQVRKSTLEIQELNIADSIDKTDREKISQMQEILVNKYKYREETYYHVGKYFEDNRLEEQNLYDAAKSQAEKYEEQYISLKDSIIIK